MTLEELIREADNYSEDIVRVDIKHIVGAPNATAVKAFGVTAAYVIPERLMRELVDDEEA